MGLLAQVPGNRPRKGKVLTVVSSTCPRLATAVVGDGLECRGQWQENARFGVQFAVSGSDSTATPLPGVGVGVGESPLEATRAWLLSGALPGVGPKTAARILEAFGDRTQALLDELAEEGFDPAASELLRVPGVGPKLLGRMAGSVRKAGAGRAHVQVRGTAAAH